jgi:hypothetical protein
MLTSIYAAPVQVDRYAFDGIMKKKLSQNQEIASD